MEDTIKIFRPIISVEVGDMEIEGVPLSKEIVRFLMEKGYQSYEHRDGNIIMHKPQERYEHNDLFFIPEPWSVREHMSGIIPQHLQLGSRTVGP